MSSAIPVRDGLIYSVGYVVHTVGGGVEFEAHLVCSACDWYWHQTYKVGDRVESKVECPQCGLVEETTEG